jgi:hypothetical protein
VDHNSVDIKGVPTSPGSYHFKDRDGLGTAGTLLKHNGGVGFRRFAAFAAPES